MKRRILFVDDELRVLQGLQRLLHPMRSEWDMRFVTGGEEALALLVEEKFDVVVTDMRMPGMDGAELLERVRQRQPDTVRIVLSGYADRETVLRSVGMAHQYLAKPCDSELLRRVIRRACGLRQYLAQERLSRLVAQMTTLPSLPALYQRVVAALQDPNASARTVGELVAQDVGMTAKVLQLVNSAYFGLHCAIADPVQATVYLGLDTVRTLVLAAGVFAQLEQKVVESGHIEELWQHSMRTCGLARLLASHWRENSRAVDETTMAGILHDVGKLVLAANFPAEYARACLFAGDQLVMQQEAEEGIFGAGHAEVGAYLLGLWGLPDPVVEALAYHHAPHRCESEQAGPLAAVHIADALDHSSASSGDKVPVPPLDNHYLGRLGLPAALGHWQAVCRSLPSEGSP